MNKSRAYNLAIQKKNSKNLREVAKILGYSSKDALIEDAMKESPRLKRAMGKLSSEDKQRIFGRERDSKYQQVDMSSLTSSWQEHGTYFRNVMKKQGRLDLKLKSGKTYSYYGVPKHVWIKMKSANGSGTVFWAYYLRKYMSNKGHRRIGVILEMMGA